MPRTIAQSKFYQVRPIDENMSFGVVVNGIDPDRFADQDLRADLRALWIREGVVVFEGIDGQDTQLELSTIFGKPILHPAKENNYDRAGIVNVRYTPEDGWVTRVDGELRGQWLPWHSDLIYVDKINHGGILRPLTLPSRLGQTGFADKISAYALLPTHLREQIEGLHVVYNYDLNPDNQRFGRRANTELVHYSTVAGKIAARLHEFPLVAHPLVFEQAGTGRKVLNVSPWFSCGIEEMPGAEGDALLEEVMQHALNPANIYMHEWSMNQMVLWDNWRMLHMAAGAPADEVRHLQRTTIDGDYGLGRLHDRAAVNPTEYIMV